MRRTLAGFAIVAMTLANADAFAAGTGGCDAFDWPLATEMAWLSAPDPVAAEAGSEMPALPEKAIALSLVPEAEAALPAPASGKPKSVAPNPFAGTVTIAAVQKPGVYQVTLSGAGWIDVIQDGKPLPSVAHTGMADCPAIRKSVRFELKAGKVTLQVSSAAAKDMLIAVRAAD